VVKLSKRRVQFVAGRRSRHVVKVTAPTGSVVICGGGLPKGARCQVRGQREVIIEGTSEVKKAGTYRLTIRVAAAGETVKRTVTVVFKLPGRRLQR
jgi:hypothetical protein